MGKSGPPGGASRYGPRLGRARQRHVQPAVLCGAEAGPGRAAVLPRAAVLEGPTEAVRPRHSDAAKAAPPACPGPDPARRLRRKRRRKRYGGRAGPGGSGGSGRGPACARAVGRGAAERNGAERSGARRAPCRAEKVTAEPGPPVPPAPLPRSGPHCLLCLCRRQEEAAEAAEEAVERPGRGRAVGESRGAAAVPGQRHRGGSARLRLGQRPRLRQSCSPPSR